MERVLEPEWLDELDPSDPRAVRSRADLRLINGIMFQPAIMAGALRTRGPKGGDSNSGGGAPRSLLEIGSGDGDFLRSTARRWGRQEGPRRLVMLDRQPALTPGVVDDLTALGWAPETVTADVFDHLPASSERYAAISANLFLHHFEDDRLKALLALVADRCDRFVACEPRRSRFAEFASRLLFALGCNDVTRHDALLSVRAGFTGKELSDLWPGAGAWRLEERAVGPLTHLFIAHKAGASAS